MPSTIITTTSATRQHDEHRLHAVLALQPEQPRRRRARREMRQHPRKRERPVRVLAAPEDADDGRRWLRVGVAPEQCTVGRGRQGGEHDGSQGDDQRSDVHAAPALREQLLLTLPHRRLVA